MVRAFCLLAIVFMFGGCWPEVSDGLTASSDEEMLDAVQDAGSPCQPIPYNYPDVLSSDGSMQPLPTGSRTLVDADVQACPKEDAEQTLLNVVP